ncbi:hypothetical protein G6F57_005718 [Rhizopus arrhizus]|uniref:PH domain-containing protein n=1 Tax=Rhizopus oryzae TaxID=64495 RepID=A0A9P6WZF6_RHIOR|nr:hypothetical protein G6F23_009131 [Rhizopus arrhizus]KAG0763977.1 hypothetical protein G6F24_005590 [Rhizopus arrhizus]KAG0781808.1 hypothetical protein G6F21_011448 [Rhizopus arrhizus]KAG0812064.1 hypothetical protein G6F20_006663 [Rhizopus arrhizus]KAG0831456.1 hypothetical protein G6F19_006736 [Rhizopus arrhizus]
MSELLQKSEPISILKHQPSSSLQEPSSLVGKSARVMLSEDEEEEGEEEENIKSDDDEPGTEPVSAEAMELLQTEKVFKTGYLLKKGEKRRRWKKRWFVLRATKLAMYKDKKEYKLLRLIDLHEIHKVVQVTTKHKYKFVFAFVTPKRMYYVQANDQNDMNDWFYFINQAKEEQKLYDLDDTSSIDRDQEFAKDVISSYKSNYLLQQKKSNESHAVSIPNHSDRSCGDYYPASPTSDPATTLHLIEGVASSEEDEEYSADKANIELEENRNRVLIEGYLLKLGRNKGWRKRWFVLRTDTLSYYEDDKEYSPHRIIPLDHIIDSLEVEPVSKNKQYCFKIIIPKRSYVLCAPNEVSMESWLNSLVVATRRAKKETLDETQEQRALSRIPENTIEKLNSTPSSHSSVENISHLSGLSGAGGVGGAGGALGGYQRK